MRTANGGGWGDPSEREFGLIVDDVRNEMLDVDQAVKHYGVDRGEILKAIS
jgi:N-methylhydantoinase B/oxoprolinase/acetone carboxylase alpha subunit